ncbi:unannotated protein [freshwater metagenome]|uniref:Unannotated protein n=1 Tax=freshwater metagenome TaxID=449393 RepID=A0A6J6RFN2_9ZZZZ
MLQFEISISLSVLLCKSAYSPKAFSLLNGESLLIQSSMESREVESFGQRVLDHNPTFASAAAFNKVKYSKL